MAYECPGCEGEGEKVYEFNLEPTTCETCGGEGKIDTRVFCNNCSCHESQCECEEPDFCEDENLKEIENDSEEDSADDEIQEDDEDIEQDSEEGNEEDY